MHLMYVIIVFPESLRIAFNTVEGDSRCARVTVYETEIYVDTMAKASVNTRIETVYNPMLSFRVTYKIVDNINALASNIPSLHC